jgi:2-dehydro-3-deoxygalactonokinase
MTGELFSLLSQQSVLRYSMQDVQWSDEAFDRAVAEVLQDPSLLAGKLFGLRAESLVGDAPASELRARLSGLLVGSELAATRNFWTDSSITIVGDDTIASLYVRSLSTQVAHVSRVDGNTMSLAGIVSHYRVLQES